MKSYKARAEGPSGQAFARAVHTCTETAAGCAAYAEDVARISTDELPDPAVVPMRRVVAAMQAVAQACATGDRAATQRAHGQFLVAMAEFSKTPGISA